MAKITDKVLKETNQKYKSTLEDVWASVLQYLEDVNVISTNAVRQFFLLLPVTGMKGGGMLLNVF